MQIKVLPFDQLKKDIDQFDVVVTILEPGYQQEFGLPKLRSDQKAIRVWCDDVSDSQHQLDKWKIKATAPRIEEFQRILDEMKPYFNTDARVGIACRAGISRSSSTALMLLVAESGNVNEAYDRWLAIERSPYFWPNDRIIMFADYLLGLNKRLIRKALQYKNDLRIPLYMVERNQQKKEWNPF